MKSLQVNSRIVDGPVIQSYVSTVVKDFWDLLSWYGTQLFHKLTAIVELLEKFFVLSAFYLVVEDKLSNTPYKPSIGKIGQNLLWSNYLAIIDRYLSKAGDYLRKNRFHTTFSDNSGLC